jgi:hypothetical protein
MYQTVDHIAKYNAHFITLGTLTKDSKLPLIVSKYPRIQNFGCFIITPNLLQVMIAVEEGHLYYEFVTSNSSEYLKMSQNKTLIETKTELKYMIDYVITHNQNNNIKLSIIYDDIDEDGCNNIISELMYYYNLYGSKINYFCICDPYKKINAKKYFDIIDSLVQFNVDRNKIIIDVHMNIRCTENIKEMHKIINTCLEFKINKFCVSLYRLNESLTYTDFQIYQNARTIKNYATCN